mgnify:FL=1
MGLKDGNIDNFFTLVPNSNASGSIVPNKNISTPTAPIDNKKELTELIDGLIDHDEYNTIKEELKDAEIVEVSKYSDTDFVNIKLTKSQLDLISNSLDLYSKIGLLQLSHAILPYIKKSNKFAYNKNKEEIILMLKKIRNLLIQNNNEYEKYHNDLSNWSLGLYNDCIDDDTKLAYELHHNIEHYKYTMQGGDNKYANQFSITDEPKDVINLNTNFDFELC